MKKNKQKRKPRPVCWLVTYLSSSTYMTRLIESTNKGKALYNEIINAGDELAQSISPTFTGCVVLSLTKLN